MSGEPKECKACNGTGYVCDGCGDPDCDGADDCCDAGERECEDCDGQGEVD